MSKTHALIIDDNPTNLDVLVQLLEHEDISSTTIQNPMEITHTPVEKIDLIFLDLEMPGISGYQMHDILSEKYGSDIPIVAYTVHSNEINAAREKGFHSFLGKPLNIQRFGSQIARILAGEHVWEVQ